MEKSLIEQRQRRKIGINNINASTGVGLEICAPFDFIDYLTERFDEMDFYYDKSVILISGSRICTKYVFTGTGNHSNSKGPTQYIFYKLTPQSRLAIDNLLFDTTSAREAVRTLKAAANKYDNKVYSTLKSTQGEVDSAAEIIGYHYNMINQSYKQYTMLTKKDEALFVVYPLSQWGRNCIKEYAADIARKYNFDIRVTTFGS